jgi:outer membrane immunogenic protein
MKSMIIAGLTAALMASSAMAADLIVTEPAAPVVASQSVDWNGFYIGINGGYAGGTFEHPFTITDPTPPPTTIGDGSIDVTAGGFVGGVQAGYNFDVGGFVVGLEADAQGSTVEGRVGINGTLGPAPGLPFDLSAGTNLDWFGTLRGRVGVTMDQALIYGTGGLAYGRTTSSIEGEFGGGAPFDVSVENDRVGWTVGAGIEYALTDSLSLKTEYLYTDLGTEELVSGSLGGFDATLDSTVAFHTVRAGLNFQF